MNTVLSINEFSEQVCNTVRKALPQELSEAEAHTSSLDIWAGGPRMAVLVSRPWNNTITGFCLDRHYKDYTEGSASVESAAAAIINDRRLYRMPDDSSPDAPEQQAAVIYA